MSIHNNYNFFENSTRYVNGVAEITNQTRNYIGRVRFASFDNFRLMQPFEWANGLEQKVKALEETHIPALTKSIQLIFMDGNFTNETAEILTSEATASKLLPTGTPPDEIQDKLALIPVGDKIKELKIGIETLRKEASRIGF